MVNLELKFPDGFFDEEVKDGFTVTRERKEIWAVELDLLYKLQNVCRTYNLALYADGGTVLGAVRHKGFIPWDDDIDLSMPRKDYNKLCEIAPRVFDKPYFFQTEFTDPGSGRGHAQLRNSNTTGILNWEKNITLPYNLGMFIDIFPLDNIPDNDQQRIQFYKNLSKLTIAERRYRERFFGFDLSEGWRKDIKHIFNKMMRPFVKSYNNEYASVIEDEKQRYITVNSNQIANLVFVSGNYQRCIWDKDIFERYLEVPFEFLTVKIPAKYDEYLTHTYGDWRTPVRGANTHGSVLFDTNKPYTAYLKEHSTHKR